MDSSNLGAIDCDLHPAIPGMGSLLPYMDEYWRQQIESRGIDSIDLSSYPPRNPLAARSDWRPQSGRAGSALADVQTEALDRFGASVAICNVLCGAQGTFNPYYAAAMSRAVNTWLAREWLDRDQRLRASIVVPLQDPERAAEEIAFWADDQRFVQVLLPVMTEVPLGRKHYWPIYREAARHGLPVGVHAGSMMRHPSSWSGWPSFFIEEYAANSQAFQGQLLSFVYEGVFQKFPQLRVVLLESGVSWLPSFLWRMVMTWRSLRMEVPWVDRSPAEIVREHVRLTVQPFDAPPDRDQLMALLEQIGSEDMLLFATDFPHWQFDGDAVLPGGLPEDVVRKIMLDNPLCCYPRLRNTLP